MPPNQPVKKLIEVSLPLDAINRESAREKSIRHGHPSTLHLWWARRPLAAARAVIWSSLVDDPSSHPEHFASKEEQDAERERLHALLTQLVKWENSNNESLLRQARAEIQKYATPQNTLGGGEDTEIIHFLDPFSGGGSIPLEAQRLGLEAHAHDLNPVAVMINKAMIEIPPLFAGKSPVNPEAGQRLGQDREWQASTGLAEDVRYYGEWMKQEAFRRIEHLYPKVQLPAEQGGGEATVIAWIWARTVKCPNPACGCEMPLAASFVLSKTRGKEAWIEPCAEGQHISYVVHSGKCPKDKETNKLGKGAVFKCPACGATTEKRYVYDAFRARNNGSVLMAIVAEGRTGRVYLSPNETHKQAADIPRPDDYPQGEMPKNPRWFSPPMFGLEDFSDIFTPRQLTALTTFSDLVTDAQHKATQDALACGMADDDKGLAEGGSGAAAYGQAVGVYLAFAVDKLTDLHSTICSWNTARDNIRNVFARQAIPMVWDYAEANPFCNSSGCFDNILTWICSCICNLPASALGHASQQAAQTECRLRQVVISTDPPYYDNIGYADLSDFFYIWMRRSLKNIYPQLFRTMLVPKAEELVATPYRFDGDKGKARDFFEEGMVSACRQLHAYACDDVPVTIYYAYKQSENDEPEGGSQASTGWETMLSAIIRAGFAITGTWPMRTERPGRSVEINTNALASSIVLVCRKRAADAPACTRRDFLANLRRELRPAIATLQASNIAPVDMAQAAIGPGMAVYSRYSKVLEADGTTLSVRKALHSINQELDAFLTEQDGDMDEVSRLCLELYKQKGFEDISFGEADVLARAKNTSIEALTRLGLAEAQKGVVHLLKRDRIEAPGPNSERCLWLLTQQMAHAMQEDGITGCATILSRLRAMSPDRVRNLAYRLYSFAEQKGWSQEAYAYNSLVVHWPDIKEKTLETTETTLIEGRLI